MSSLSVTLAAAATAASRAKAARDRRRFRGLVPTRVVCGWCDKPFTYERHFGRMRSYCSDACRKAMACAQVLARAHYERRATIRPKRRCPARLRCLVCNGQPPLPGLDPGGDVRAS